MDLRGNLANGRGEERAGCGFDSPRPTRKTPVNSLGCRTRALDFHRDFHQSGEGEGFLFISPLGKIESEVPLDNAPIILPAHRAAGVSRFLCTFPALC